MAEGLERGDRARARAAQAARIPAICNMFPTTMERRPKIFRWGSELEAFIFAAAFRGRIAARSVSHVYRVTVLVRKSLRDCGRVEATQKLDRIIDPSRQFSMTVIARLPPTEVSAECTRNQFEQMPLAFVEEVGPRRSLANPFT
jgi:hypothetical protein